MVFLLGTVLEKIEMKGLDIVRRDWCGLAQDSGKWVEWHKLLKVSEKVL